MKHNILFALVSLVLLNNNCTEPPGAEVFYSILLKNESDKALSYIVNYNYPDTIIPPDYNDLKGIPINDKVYIDSRKKWEKVFEEDLSNDTLSIFIFDEIITPENWDQVRSNYDIAKRYDLSLKDLQQLNSTVTYPPTDAMKDIKMYPK